VSAFVDERFGAAAGVEPLFGDASTRRYYRVLHGGSSSVLALYPEPFRTDTLPFVVIRSLLAGWGLPVPEIRDEDGDRGILLLQDLGDTTLQEGLRSATSADRDRLYREALEQLVRLQEQAASGPGTAPCFRVAFDVEKLSWELHYFLKHFLEGLRGRDLSVEDRATLAAGFQALAEQIASWPRVLSHRDFHSRNLMMHDETLYWIDFQDARMGPVTYDLASLLLDSYVDIGEDFVAERLEEFRRRASPEEDACAFRERFELTCVQRNLKALGTFGYMASVRGNTVYLPYIPHTLAHARRNLSRHPSLAGTWRVLARHLEELA
jgi:hypothetical protein